MIQVDDHFDVSNTLKGHYGKDTIVQILFKLSRHLLLKISDFLWSVKNLTSSGKRCSNMETYLSGEKIVIKDVNWYLSVQSLRIGKLL